MSFLIIVAMVLAFFHPVLLIKAMKATNGTNESTVYTVAACVSFGYIIFMIFQCTFE